MAAGYSFSLSLWISGRLVVVHCNLKENWVVLLISFHSSVVTVSEFCILLVFLFVSFTVGEKKVSVSVQGEPGITRFLERDAMQLFWATQTCVCCMDHSQCGCWLFFNVALQMQPKTKCSVIWCSGIPQDDTKPLAEDKEPKQIITIGEDSIRIIYLPICVFYLLLLDMLGLTVSTLGDINNLRNNRSVSLSQLAVRTYTTYCCWRACSLVSWLM